MESAEVAALQSAINGVLQFSVAWKAATTALSQGRVKKKLF